MFTNTLERIFVAHKIILKWHNYSSKLGIKIVLNLTIQAVFLKF